MWGRRDVGCVQDNSTSGLLLVLRNFGLNKKRANPFGSNEERDIEGRWTQDAFYILPTNSTRQVTFCLHCCHWRRMS